MWKVLVTIAILGFAGIQAQEVCIQCRSNATNQDCVYPERLDRFSLACNTSTGFCFTRVFADGHLQRGCASELETTECEGELCVRCPLISGGNAPCNIEVLPVDRLSCYTCTGDRNSTCAQLSSNATTEHRAICPIFRNDDQCVATRSEDTIHRGCLSEFRNVNCETTHNCCMGHGCNHWEFEQVRDGALSIHSVLKVSMIALIGIIVGYNNL